jgi:hypothetical protein
MDYPCFPHVSVASPIIHIPLKYGITSITMANDRGVLPPGLEGTNPGISSKASVTIRINARFEKELPMLRIKGGFSAGFLKMENDRGKIAANASKWTDNPKILLI